MGVLQAPEQTTYTGKEVGALAQQRMSVCSHNQRFHDDI